VRLLSGDARDRRRMLGGACPSRAMRSGETLV
jgi:hypothetical protein